jgi:hypothetical protein
MKKKTKILLYIVLLVTSFIFYGCQKEIQERNDFVLLSKEEARSKVANWLNKEQALSAKGRKEKIQQLEDYLDFDRVCTEQLNAREKLIIIPVKGGYKTVNNKGKSVSSTAVFIVNKDGEIRQGNVLQYASGSADKGNDFPDNTIAKIYNNQKIECSGKFTLLSVYDRFEYELTYNEGNLQSAGYMKPKTSANGRSSVCLAWYLVTTTFYSDGSQGTTETFLGTTCYESGCYPSDPNLQSLDCLEPGSGDIGEMIVLLTSVVEVDSVLSHLQQPCFVNAFNKVTSARLENELAKMYSQTYVGLNKVHNLTVWESSFLPGGAIGNSVRGPNPDTWEIYLNTSFADTLTQEYLGAVLLHELVHGFIDKNELGFNNSSDLSIAHRQMLDNWITQIQAALTECFGLPYADALALSIGGFDDILKNKVNQNFKDDMKVWMQAKYSVDLTDAAALAKKYYTGEKGIKCN